MIYKGAKGYLVNPNQYLLEEKEGKESKYKDRKGLRDGGYIIVLSLGLVVLVKFAFRPNSSRCTGPP
jgi:hypothetical protein